MYVVLKTLKFHKRV